MRAESLPLRDPTRLLYHHAVELALKACLLASGLSIPIGRAGHEITGLYSDCREHGLLGDNEYYDMHNLIALLESRSFGQRSRYAAEPDQDSMSDLDRHQGSVAMLIGNVKPKVSAWTESYSGKPPVRNSLPKAWQEHPFDDCGHQRSPLGQRRPSPSTLSDGGAAVGEGEA